MRDPSARTRAHLPTVSPNASRDFSRTVVAGDPLRPLRRPIRPAWGNEVVSSNIVGYNKITLQPGLNMIGGLFQKVGTDSALLLNDQFVDAATAVNYGASADAADTITTWDATRKGYTKIYYYYADRDDPDPDYDDKWYDTDTEDIANVTIADESGATGAWYKNTGNSPITVTMAGEVPTNAVYSVELVNGLNFIANPYPQKIAINGNYFEVEDVFFGPSADVADTITTWDAARKGYTKIYYYYADPDDPDPDYDDKWYDTDTEDITTFQIEPGQGFWYNHRGTGATLKFKKPY